MCWTYRICIILFLLLYLVLSVLSSKDVSSDFGCSAFVWLMCFITRNLALKKRKSTQMELKKNCFSFHAISLSGFNGEKMEWRTLPWWNSTCQSSLMLFFRVCVCLWERVFFVIVYKSFQEGDLFAFLIWLPLSLFFIVIKPIHIYT